MPRKKKLPVADQEPVMQLGLFRNFLGDRVDDLSNTILLWDLIPKYSISRQTQDKMRDDKGNLPLRQVSFKHQGAEFIATIQPAMIQIKNHDGEFETKSYYPSATEELVEEALRKLAADQNLQGGFYIEANPIPKTGVMFTLYQLQEELKKHGHTRSVNELKQSLEVLSGSLITISGTTIDSSEIYNRRSPYLAGLDSVTKKDLSIDPSRKWVAHFHPMVSQGIGSLNYRQYNYSKLMDYTTQLSRWIQRYLIHKYTFASLYKKFSIQFSTIKRDSGMLDQYTRQRAAIQKCDESLDELVKANVLTGYEREEVTGSRGKIYDVTYQLTASPEFIKEAKAANKRLLLDRDKLPKLKTIS